jgi:hypothetical protein
MSRTSHPSPPRSRAEVAPAPRWIRVLATTIATVILGPPLVGMLLFGLIALGPVALVGLPFVVFGLHGDKRGRPHLRHTHERPAGHVHLTPAHAH